MSGLPEGFVIDEPAAKGGLPEGFVIDEPGVMDKITKATTAVREAIHAPTRALTSGALMGQGERVGAAMDTMMGRGSYGDNLAGEEAKTAEFAKANPGAAQALEVAGSMAPLGAAARAVQGIPKAIQGLSPVDQAILAQLGGAGKYAAPVAEAAMSAIPGPGPGLLAKGGKLAMDAAKSNAAKIGASYFGLDQLIRYISGGGR